MRTLAASLALLALAGCAIQAKNSAGKAAYTRPCPPKANHHDRFRVYAMPSIEGLPDDPDLDGAHWLMREASLGYGGLTGTFGR